MPQGKVGEKKGMCLVSEVAKWCADPANIATYCFILWHLCPYFIATIKWHLECLDTITTETIVLEFPPSVPYVVPEELQPQVYMMFRIDQYFYWMKGYLLWNLYTFLWLLLQYLPKTKRALFPLHHLYLNSCVKSLASSEHFIWWSNFWMIHKTSDSDGD